MAQSVVSIPQSIDEKGSFDENCDLTSNITPYTVPALDVDLSMAQDYSRKRRFSVSAESNCNDDSDFDDDNDDDDSKSQSNHSRTNSNENNNTTNNSNTTDDTKNNSESHTNSNNTKTKTNTNNKSYNNNKKKHFIRKVYPKTQGAISRILTSVSELFLWNGSDSEQQKLLVDAMFEKKVSKNESIITQGDRGDYFYVIESGIFEVWKSETRMNKNGTKFNAISRTSKPAIKVFEYDNKGSFGELALMYNSPRAATVKAQTDGILWAVDRKTFRHIIVGSTARKRHRYDKFLKKLEIFNKNISETTQSQIADILEGFEFSQGETIIKQGSDNCEKFYLIQHGTANVVIKTNDGKTNIVSTLRSDDFFGERALITNEGRSASVIVTSKSFVCCGMDKASFTRLLGGLDKKFSTKMNSYTYQSELEDCVDKDADSDLGSDQDMAEQ